MNESIESYKIIAPSIREENYSSAYIFGNVVWLLMHSKTHADMPLSLLASQVWPALQSKQYVLVLTPEGKPVFYMAWAHFSEEEETKYIQHPYTNLALTRENWTSGDRPWILFWVAPFGHSQQMSRWVRENIFCDFPEIRYLHHQGRKRGTRVISVKGENCTKEECRIWSEAHPILPEISRIWI